MRGSLLVSLLAVLLPQAAPQPKPSKGKGGLTGTLAKETLKVGGQNREYRLVVPRKIDGSVPVPIVFVFHGLGDSKENISLYSGFESLAGKKSFIAVFPDAIDKKWNLNPLGENEDFRFFDALLDHLASNYNIDLGRVFLTGMSMGGYFSNTLGSQRSEKIAAIAPHSGGLGFLAVRGIHAKRKYPVMIIHGDQDNVVKVEEGRKAKDAYQKEGHTVEYVEIAGLGHMWAFKDNIAEKIWKFFSEHPLP